MLKLMIDRGAHGMEATVEQLAASCPFLLLGDGALMSSCIVGLQTEFRGHRVGLVVVVGVGPLLEDLVIMTCAFMIEIERALIAAWGSSPEAIVGESVRHLHD